MKKKTLDQVIKEALKAGEDPRFKLAQRLDENSRRRIFETITRLQTVPEIMALAKYLYYFLGKQRIMKYLERYPDLVKKCVDEEEKEIRAGITRGKEMYEKYRARIYEGLYALTLIESKEEEN